MEQIKKVPPSPSQVMAYKLAYPEIYYRLQPYIIMVCDQLDLFDMPSQETLDRISDTIYDDICKKYPDIEKYVLSQEGKANDDPSIPTISRFDGSSFFGFRRRGVFRDLIDILLLSELLGRRRRIF